MNYKRCVPRDTTEEELEALLDLAPPDQRATILDFIQGIIEEERGNQDEMVCTEPDGIRKDQAYV